VAGIRAQHGMVFRLELATVGYYKVLKSGETVTG
jgi:hypothetical protein